MASTLKPTRTTAKNGLPWLTCLRDRSAVSTVEYGVVLAIVATAIALAAVLLGNSISSGMHNASANSDAEVISGRGAFIRPPAMEVERWYPIEFLVGPTNEVLTEQSEGATLAPVRPLPISKTMQVELLPDPNFQLRTKSEVRQDLGADRYAAWQWDVKPKYEGSHILIARVDVLERGKDGKLRAVERYSRRVTVRVGVGGVQKTLNGIENTERLSNAATGLIKSLAGLFAALAALIAAIVAVRWRRRRRRQSTDVATE